MNSLNWIELATLLVSVGGGGTVGVSKLTRIAVAAENLAEQIKSLAGAQAKTADTVQDHENRLNKANL
jgi:hypothetical protein